MVTILAILIFGLIAMVFGAELLVRGASRLAAMVGVSELVIGLTIVSFGTSAPELVVSIKGALTNHSELVVGNCIGSNIFNILFIIGACAVIAPLVVTKELIRLDVPIMIASTLFFLLLSWDGVIDRSDALLLLTSFALYYGFVVRKSLQENSSEKTEFEGTFLSLKSHRTSSQILKQIALIIIGLILCISGAEWLVDSAVKLARVLGISELVIGLTIVSIGTSLPEVATSIVATVRGQRDIAIGNAVGSCIFNILGVIGVASLIAPEGISVPQSILRFDLPVAIASAIACLPVFFTDYKISRLEGFIFLFYYAAYIAYILLEAQKHDALPFYSMVMFWFTIPLMVLTFTVIAYRAVRTGSHD